MEEGVSGLDTFFDQRGLGEDLTLPFAHSVSLTFLVDGDSLVTHFWSIAVGSDSHLARYSAVW